MSRTARHRTGAFTGPNEDGTYKHTDAVPFGKPLTVPSPFDVQPATEEFPGAS
ncbi:hypothetical protein [Streptomyces globisporus]